jgi:hypothetical protein
VSPNPAQTRKTPRPHQKDPQTPIAGRPWQKTDGKHTRKAGVAVVFRERRGVWVFH